MLLRLEKLARLGLTVFAHNGSCPGVHRYGIPASQNLLRAQEPKPLQPTRADSGAYGFDTGGGRENFDLPGEAIHFVASAVTPGARVPNGRPDSARRLPASRFRAYSLLQAGLPLIETLELAIQPPTVESRQPSVVLGEPRSACRPAVGRSIPKPVGGLPEKLATGKDAFGNDLSGGAGRRRSHIGNKVTDGKINFATHGRDHRQDGIEHSPGDHLFVESP